MGLFNKKNTKKKKVNEGALTKKWIENVWIGHSFKMDIQMSVV